MILPLANKVVKSTGIDSLLGASLAIAIAVTIIILLICYLAGYLIKKGLIKGWGTEVEEILFRSFPFLQVLKFRFISESEGLKSPWKPILLPEDNFLRIAFITDDTDEEYYSVFIPDAPKMDAGELRIILKKNLDPQFISMKNALDGLSTFGKKMPNLKTMMRQ
ncbi:DUF502 domain-containing protein [Marinigracilibium pacificum]|uniref:DUF502 domain-containing protein n=1 Tax=Marinigracilibium pacificum TaxID=2729599 RepID=A0A848J4H4_9BACT|nr:hypothetical protein [Marinigracilibium pacificum]NMM50395.1 DUF502 domain-containing protein [Marinigracilibium pacificum]